MIIGAVAGGIGGAINASGCPAVGQAVASGIISAASNVAEQMIVEHKEINQVDWVDVAVDGVISAGCSMLESTLTSKASKASESTIKKGIDRVVTGRDRYKSGFRYYKGALKRGMSIIKGGVHSLNIARGTSSVCGSVSNFVLGSSKTLVRYACN